MEDIPHVRLGLSEPHVEQLGTFDGHEVHLTLVGDRLGQHRLAAAGRAVEQHALGRLAAEVPEQLRVLDRVLDEFPQFLLDVFQAADVLPSHRRRFEEILSQNTRV